MTNNHLSRFSVCLDLHPPVFAVFLAVCIILMKCNKVIVGSFVNVREQRVWFSTDLLVISLLPSCDRIRGACTQIIRSPGAFPLLNMAVITDQKNLSPVTEECVSGLPTTRELTIITVAAVCSVTMKLIQSSRDRTHSNAGQQTFLMTFLVVLSPIAAITTTSVALGLGWARLISIDALAAVLFALIPGVLSLPMDSFNDTILRLSLLSRGRLYESLRSSEDRFRYIKVGYPCSVNDIPERGKENRLEFCSQTKQRALRLYIACFPRRYSSFQPVRRSLKLFFRNHFPHFATEAKSIQEEKVCFIEYQNNKNIDGPLIEELETHSIYIANRGFHYRTYRSVKSAMWLTKEPWRVFLDTPEEVLHALVLLLDILMIGNLVLCFHKKYLMECKKESVWSCSTGSPALIHTHLIRELKLVDWLPEHMHAANTRHEADNENQHPETCYQQYREDLSFLFLLLIYKSNKFRKRKGVTHISKASAADAPHQIYRSGSLFLEEVQNMEGDEIQLWRRLKQMVDDWLISWGCDGSALQEESGLEAFNAGVYL